ncbi:MAG TPA: YeeE/YedE thiosulfate transporter family protein, partial [Candidatus Kapabacteria bacterium]|nr:YeeE/YedE thiosulfate transporter family protein [Candidatus Kapabacteria bacterium]
MGPFVPDIISNELNLIVALIIGFFFGFILEQAGFSSSRKLAGLFYGYDFTVLRVLFTAGVTAMIGIIVLSFLGIVDWNMLFINPTFRYSAIIGGIIMGAGFIIGGYCPGTSFAGASIGKIDAIVFIVGGILGVFVFAELYPYFKDIYLGFDYGELRIDKLLNVNPGIIALGFTLMAFVAFIITSKIERKVNNISTHSKKFFELPENKPLLFGFAFIAVSLILTFLPTR